MPQIIDKKQIKGLLDRTTEKKLIAAMEEGFAAYSRGEVVVPPVGHLQFEQPPGDTHIKYGYIRGDEYYVIKIASGFYNNPAQGLPSSNGLILVFSQQTGELLGILLDEGLLTDVRTGLAGAVAARHLAPSKVEGIGIVGTGIQARMQLYYLKQVTSCRTVTVWGRSEEKLEQYIADMKPEGFDITPTQHIEALTSSSNLIVTCTPATSPLLSAGMIRPGTHITAVGSDTKGKQELESTILDKAGLVVADSLSQCVDHGETHYAVKEGLIEEEDVVELGRIIEEGKGRSDDDQITVADLTGVAVQDIQIARLVYKQL